MDRLKMQTADLADDNFKKLAEMFPNAVTESIDANGAVVRAIDADVLAPGDKYNGCFRQERNAISSHGQDKKKSVLLANAPIAAALRPCRDESVDFDNTENLYIEGDNLDVLKLLKTYLNRVKMIYIDPPYNTGNDFVYEDDFAEDRDTFLDRDGQYDEQGNRMVKNLDSNGRFHTDWLNMIYPRLRVARDLLTDDGVIFISIDDNEVENLKKICNEIFGASNFIANVVWEKKYTRANDAKWFSDNHDHILCYGKNKQEVFLNMLSRNNEQLAAYSNPDNHPMGAWKATPLHAKSGTNTSGYTFKNGVVWQPPVGTYRRFSDESLKEMDENDEVWFGLDEKQIPSRKSFLSEVKEGVTPTTIWSYKEVGHNHEANNELKSLKIGGVFNNPKPVRLLMRMLSLTTNTNDFILDFFSGSATTAHAVMQLNAEDGGRRKFIMVQIPEVTDENSEAYKAGYKNICEIGKERIRRAGEKIVGSLELGVEREDESKKLSGVDCLAKGDGARQGSLFNGEEAAERGDVCAFGSDAASGGVHSVEHSGGAGEGIKQGIHSVPLDSERLSCRIGNTASSMCTGRLLDGNGNISGNGSVAGDKEDDKSSDQALENRESAPGSQLLTPNSPLAPNSQLDVGFRVLKLDSSNMKDVYYTPEEYARMNFDLFGFKDNIKPDRTEEDLLFQVMLDLGIPLSAKIEREGKTFSVDGNYLIACFDYADTELITEIAKKQPYYAVFRDASFVSDSALVNFEQVFNTYSPKTIRKVL